MDYYYCTDNSDKLVAGECIGRYCPLYYNYWDRDYLCCLCYYLDFDCDCDYDYFSQEICWLMIQFMIITCLIQRLFIGLKMLFIREISCLYLYMGLFMVDSLITILIAPEFKK